MPRSRMAPSSLLPLVLVATAGLATADITDWLNVNYVLKQVSASTASTSPARQNIVTKAGSTAQSGPWSVVTNNSAKPPNGDVHDYLSWAPYYWPQCNWCSQGTNHLAGPATNNTGDNGLDDSSDDDDDSGSFEGDDPYEDGGEDADDQSDVKYDVLSTDVVLLPRDAAHFLHGAHSSHAHRRMFRRRRPLMDYNTGTDNAVERREDDEDCSDVLLAADNLPVTTTTLAAPDTAAALTIAPTPTNVPTPPDVPRATDVDPTRSILPVDGISTRTTSSHSSYTPKPITGTPAPADAHAKTGKKVASTSAKCTPSPTKSLAPSATWTTCPYVRRDGHRNPDVDIIPDSRAVMAMSQSVLYNAVSFAMGKANTYSRNAARFIDTWFLSSATAMNPNMNFGQVNRGPGKEHQMGSYTGILDLREFVKIANSIQLLKAAGSPDWTSARDKAMKGWTQSYLSWLQNSALGKQVAGTGNNHRTFYVSQLAAAQMILGDSQGAQTTLKKYFAGPFLDQIAANGEQPFEAVRERPYHYRCFNLEAMIQTNAKLGDQLGVNLWTAKSKYGSTIQTALDYTMKVIPKGEDVSEILPHVAAVAAAYGDPNGKYATFLKQKGGSYTSQPFWFYDQTDALPNSPAGRAKAAKSRREIVMQLEQAGVADSDDAQPFGVADLGTAGDIVGEAENTMSQAAEVAFACPAVFGEAQETMLDDGLSVTCEQMKPYYFGDILPINATSVV
ncbi:alginate lyase-domain-containing protein [Daedaleopsis nitida]|nr:alginate lyase-domain-containing protein [Daedaleopsis nitida]